VGAVVTALGTMAAVIGVGWLLGRRGTLGSGARTVLARTCFSVATPSLLLVTVAHADLHALLSRSALVTALSTATVAVVAIVVLAVVWRRPAPDVVIGTLASSYVNAGNLGLPLAVYLLGDAVAVVPSLLFQLLVIAPVAFTVLDGHAGATAQGNPGAQGFRGVVRRTSANPIIVGSVTGLVLAVLPWKLPTVVFGPFAMIGGAAAPLALVLFGMSIAVPRADGERTSPRELALVAVLRSVVSPVLALALGRALHLEPHALLAVVAMAALPTAQNVLVYATQYGRGQPLARDAGMLTTALAVPVMLVIAAALG
jgi:malonate transporter and related proteins